MKILKIKSLQWQLISRFILIVIILLVVSEIIKYKEMEQFLFVNKIQALELKFHSINPDSLCRFNTINLVKENANNIIDSLIDRNMSIEIIDTEGNFVAGKNLMVLQDNINGFDDKNMYHNPYNKENGITNLTIPKLSQAEYKNMFKKQGDVKGYKLIKDEAGNTQIAIWHKVGDRNAPVGIIQFTASVKFIQDMLFDEVRTFFLGSILVLFGGIILGVAVFKYTLKPLNHMTTTIENINIDQLNTRLPIESGQIEIDKLSLAFNSMLQRIETSFEMEQIVKEKMRQFVSDASHELRTPLTSIHGFVEVLLRGASKNEAKLDLALKSILIESERLAKLVSDLLLLTKLDRKVKVEIKEENLNEIIKEIHPQLKILVGERIINLNLQDNILIEVNKDQIKQVIINLVQNAVQHSDEYSGIIEISTKSELKNKLVVLSIGDNGIGISKEHLKDIFDRFFRVESHRSRKHGGYGLGLSIVKAIVDAHNGKIEVSSELGKGTKFSITFRI